MGVGSKLPATRVVPASERDLYWEWLRAEIDVPAGSPRHADRLEHGLDERQQSILAHGERGALDPSDWEALGLAYRRLRKDYLDPLLDSGTGWWYAELPVAELGEVRIPKLTISLVPLAPSRRLEELVAALDAGRETPGLPNHLVYRFLRSVYDPTRVRGRPILIAERKDGPYVPAEGLTRASVLVSRLAHGEPTPPSVRVLLGISPRASDWRWW